MGKSMFLAAAAALALAGAAPAQTIPPNIIAAVGNMNRPPADIARDDARKPGMILDFAQVKPGQTVVELIPGHGYFTRLFAVAVKPGGKVIAVVPAAATQRDPEGSAMIDAIAKNTAYGDVTVAPNLTTVTGADLVFTAQNYHDLHNALPAEGLAQYNKGVFNALKPGGLYVIVDHVALPGTGNTATQQLHRIDPSVVRQEVEAAGFVFDGESKALANPADPHTANVFDPSIKGQTDQFAYRFRKPAK